MRVSIGGCFIFTLSCFLMVFGFPGESVGISAITDSILVTTGLSRNAFSAIYTFATMTGCFLVLITAPLVDRLGVRKTSLWTLLIWGIVLLAFANGEFLYQTAFSHIAMRTAYFTIFLYLNMSLLRFIGQNMLPMLGRIQLIKAFKRKQGMAVAFGGVFVSISSGLTPRIMHSMSNDGHWQDAYKTLAMVAFAALAVFFIFFRDIDCENAHGFVQRRVPTKKSLEDIFQKKLMRIPIFWCIMLPVCINSLIGSGTMVHIVDIFRENGIGANVARNSCFYSCCISPIVGTFFGRLVDDNKIKHGVILMLCLQFFGLIGLELSRNVFGIFLYVLCIGGSWGGYGVLRTAAWSKIFGEKNIGSILGLIYFCSAMIGATSVSLMSFSKCLLGSYFHLIHVIETVILVVLIFVAKKFHTDSLGNFSNN